MKKQKKNLLYGVISIVLIMVVLFTTLLPRFDKKVDIVVLGDSIMGNLLYPTHSLDIVSEKTGKSVFNGAFGGTCMAYKQRENVMLEPAAWSMIELAEAICYGDFGLQKAALSHAYQYKNINHLVPDYYVKRMEDLSQIDFSEVEILIIEHGTNDYNTGTPLDNAENFYDKGTFGGALRSGLKLFQEKYPHLRIVLMSPVYCEVEGQGKCYEVSCGGGTLDEYVEKEKEIAEEFGIDFLDAYHQSGIWEENAKTYLFDGIHPSEEGQALLGEFIAEYLLK